MTEHAKFKTQSLSPTLSQRCIEDNGIQLTFVLESLGFVLSQTIASRQGNLVERDFFEKTSQLENGRLTYD